MFKGVVNLNFKPNKTAFLKNAKLVFKFKLSLCLALKINLIKNFLLSYNNIILFLKKSEAT